jgi:hypothetical protein
MSGPRNIATDCGSTGGFSAALMKIFSTRAVRRGRTSSSGRTIRGVRCVVVVGRLGTMGALSIRDATGAEPGPTLFSVTLPRARSKAQRQMFRHVNVLLSVTTLVIVLPNFKLPTKQLNYTCNYQAHRCSIST